MVEKLGRHLRLRKRVFVFKFLIEKVDLVKRTHWKAKRAKAEATVI